MWIWYDNVAIVKYLIELGADINQVDEHYYCKTPLCQASEYKKKI